MNTSMKYIVDSINVLEILYRNVFWVPKLDESILWHYVYRKMKPVCVCVSGSKLSCIAEWSFFLLWSVHFFCGVLWSGCYSARVNS